MAPAGALPVLLGLLLVSDPAASDSPGRDVTLRMPSARAHRDDVYLCSAFPLPDASAASYVTRFEPVDADASPAHHLILMSCPGAERAPGEIFECRLNPCGGHDHRSTLFAWTPPASPKELPEGVSFPLDGKTAQSLVLQVHYARKFARSDPADRIGLKLHYQMEPTKYLGGVIWMTGLKIYIPGHTPSYSADANCLVDAPEPVHVFAYRAHTHDLGTSVTGYRYRPVRKEYTRIAWGDPQLPQDFYETDDVYTVQPGEFLAARCTYNATSRSRFTRSGFGAGDEMCSLYLMYYSDNPSVVRPRVCVNEQKLEVSKNLPADSKLSPPKLSGNSSRHHLRSAGEPDGSASKDADEKTGGGGEKRRKGDLDFDAGNDADADANEDADTDEGKSSRRKGDLDADVDAGKDLPQQKLLHIQMPGAEPKRDDEYYCTAFSIKGFKTKGKTLYVTDFNADTTAARAHHLILEKCSNPVKGEGQIWNCLHHATCNGASKIMYAWAKDAPPTSLPPDVGFQIDEDDGYLVLQVHYAHPLKDKDFSGLDMHYTEERPKYIAGIYLLLRTYLRIPAHTALTHGDMNCKVQTPLTLFAFRTHAHSLGSVITGYQYRVAGNVTSDDGDGEDGFTEVARGDPQRPQTFYPMERLHHVKPGDFLVARCSFNSTGKSTATNIGSRSGDEMCNLYLMFYTESANEDFKMCFDEEAHSISKLLPADSDTPLPPETEEEEAGQSQPEEIVPAIAPAPFFHNAIPKKEKKQNDGRDSKQLGGSGEFFPVPNWPPQETKDKIGQLSGISIDQFGNPVIFHRGDRIWDGSTFKRNNVYNGDMRKPIPMNTVLTLNSSGHVINEWGSNMFFLPHMLTVDKQNNVWMTDVAMHQVFKFAPYGGKNRDYKPMLVLGKPFEPGSDDEHYCKPTSVAVSQSGDVFYVSDGYCNSRIVQYSLKIDAQGLHHVTKLMEWGEANGSGFTLKKSPYAFNIPHGLALAEDKRMLCVADRENGRIQCLNSDTGKFVRSLASKELGSSVYGVDYTPVEGGRIFAVGGPEPFGSVTGRVTQGYVIDINTGALLHTFNVGGANGLQKPHDVAVSQDGSTVYVIELHPFNVWKLTDGRADPPLLSAVPAVPSPSPPTALRNPNKLVPSLEQLEDMVPRSTFGVTVAMVSVSMTLCLTLCLACRRCRKRGKGTLTNGTKKSDGKLDLGGFLGRSKDGFQPLKQDDDDVPVDADLSSDSDDLEEFSVPAMRA